MPHNINYTRKDLQEFKLYTTEPQIAQKNIKPDP